MILKVSKNNKKKKQKQQNERAINTLKFIIIFVNLFTDCMMSIFQMLLLNVYTIVFINFQRQINF